MLACDAFYKKMEDLGVDFFTGVPDSLLKDICAYIADNSSKHIIAANEGGAIALATGHYLATGKVPFVYMQNSGLGNAINPLTSLTDSKVYSIPMVLMIGWRGEPGVHDEPQHVKKGFITKELLDILTVKTWIISDDPAKADKETEEAITYAREHLCPVALLIKKETFAPYKLKPNANAKPLSLTREAAIQLCAKAVDENKNSFIVSTTGMISRELYSFRKDNGKLGRDFYNVGSMGHASQIALGISLADSAKEIWCFDGDGAMLMHLGGSAIIGTQGPENFKHIVFNNGAHDSVGGQPTVGFDVNMCKIALACGYRHAESAASEADVIAAMKRLQTTKGPALLEVCVGKGARKDLGRPTSTPAENKRTFMDALNQ